MQRGLGGGGGGGGGGGKLQISAKTPKNENDLKMPPPRPLILRNLDNIPPAETGMDKFGVLTVSMARFLCFIFNL